MTLGLFDLGRAWPGLRDEVLATIDRLAATGAWTLGEELRAFESEFAAYCGVAGAVGVSDGTAALELALRALGAGPGRQVVTSPLTFIATLEAIHATGARPVLVDIDPLTNCIDPALANAAVTGDTAAIVPVHLHGRPAPVGALAGAPILEDAAQAHGAFVGADPVTSPPDVTDLPIPPADAPATAKPVTSRPDVRRVGSLGTIAAFSFYPTKPLGGIGDGGAVVSDDDALLEEVKALRHHGAAPDDANQHLSPAGRTARLDNVQAAVLRIRLRALDAENDARRAAADRYRELLADLPLDLPPGDADGGRHVYHLFSIGIDDRDRVLAALRHAGIGVGMHYPTPAHLQPGWRFLGYEPNDFPHAERAAARCLSLPLFPGITEAEQHQVADSIRRAII